MSSPTSGSIGRTCVSTRSFPVPFARRCVASRIPAEDATQLPSPEALVPLYRHLIAGQTKAESDALIDVQAWLAELPCVTSLRP